MDQRGRPIHNAYTELEFVPWRGTKRNCAKCTVCDKIITNSSIQRLKSHRKRCSRIKSDKYGFEKSEPISEVSTSRPEEPDIGTLNSTFSPKSNYQHAAPKFHPSETANENSRILTEKMYDFEKSDNRNEETPLNEALDRSTTFRHLSKTECKPLVNKYSHYSTFWRNPNDLVNRLRLLIMSRDSGNNSHTQEIEEIIQELKAAKIIA